MSPLLEEFCTTYVSVQRLRGNAGSAEKERASVILA